MWYVLGFKSRASKHQEHYQNNFAGQQKYSSSSVQAAAIPLLTKLRFEGVLSKVRVYPNLQAGTQAHQRPPNTRYTVSARVPPTWCQGAAAYPDTQWNRNLTADLLGAPPQH